MLVDCIEMPFAHVTYMWHHLEYAHQIIYLAYYFDHANNLSVLTHNVSVFMNIVYKNLAIPHEVPHVVPIEPVRWGARVIQPKDCGSF